MYFNHDYVNYNYPYGQEDYYSMPILAEDYYEDEFDVRQFMPGFPGSGGMMGPPQGPPFNQPPYGSPGQGQQAGPPSAPPPSYIPAQTQQAQAFAVDPGSIRRCLYRYTYVWLRNRQQFWFFPVFLGRTSISGYRWTGYRWVFFGVSLRQIESFTCV
ncbi:hypothetical protein JOC77_003225 [Peribacillus deserti]|uniref:Transporter n=1 Tax=Peribacillus deserti TaxID=673318 RepID=A0ABS2QKS6_9BACI|nr:hypothetical protein [Peribacillus deserti]MBM7693781.1 hypothetical protein [Peribacillus deserti]